ncbi:hypothetical protein AB870_01075 [Pandoraea faecigallinarum]|uniref:Uncharacterized protein n=2 Tax=Pandoraea faecigallinarum TaxID=656179 RepID=A0A0H3WMS9_9BURK|nr:hypothetical protein AB870_01075 [Pandoraea faecigallinarum]
MNRAIGGIITRIAASRGFAANDPRIIATLEAISTTSTSLNVLSTGVGVGLSIAGVPVWLTILAGLGIVGAGAQVLATLGNAEVAIGQTYDGSVSVVRINTLDEPIVLPPYPEFVTPQAEYKLFEKLKRLGAHVYRTADCSAANTRAACHEYPLIPSVETGIALRFQEHKLRIPFQSIAELEDLRARWEFEPGDEDPQLRLIETFDEDGEFAGFAERMWTNKHRCKKSDMPDCTAEHEWVTLKVNPEMFDITRDAFHGRNRTTSQTLYPDLNAARADMSRDILKMPISAESLASIVDQSWWQAAESPDYKGLPYDESEPVTEDDVWIWIKRNPKEVPYIGDILEPANPPDETTVPISPRVRPRGDPFPTIDPATDPRTQPEIDPVTNPDTARDPNKKPDPEIDRERAVEGVQDVNVVNRPTVDIGNRVKVDIELGNAPETTTPQLEDTPTAKMILDPLLNLTSELKSWSMPSSNGACPSATLNVFDASIPFDAHCTIAERIGPQLRQAMLAAFAVVAILIVLSA